MKNIHILSTNKPSRLIQAEDDELMLLNELYENTYNINKHIYITSDERPNTNEYYIIDGIHEVLKNDSLKFIDNNCKKIILTTDKDLINDGVQEIDDEFLEWFVKNTSCEEVKVELHIGNIRWLHSKNIYKIIIPKEEHKQETLEEVAEKWVFKTNGHKWSNNNNEVGDNYGSFIAGAKWQQEQEQNNENSWFNEYQKVEDYIIKRIGDKFLEATPEKYNTASEATIALLENNWQQERKYSEEDLRQAFFSGCQSERQFKPRIKCWEEWFEQFKKK